MAEVAANGPVSIAIAASGGLSTYRGYGIATNAKAQIDHAVALIGWGTEAGVKYWIIQVCSSLRLHSLFLSLYLCGSLPSVSYLQHTLLAHTFLTAHFSGSTIRCSVC